ncbi:hypothetical protein A8938_1839 [Algoriphagus zhangzhouensis]|uniref:ATP-grasp domain-containing protein n=2 Tax=Algoriphagus zhangzhouensis TaxID=1073327 RepID=A0A1M7Z9F3_9BACT|nr:hypothetical protein A8938_1839 [Algoriphagus zhangzhouensis]SHO61563.1 hypothetical protein SAMN04488108_1424 [Algoriphagus zhangzhouensis]
MPFGGMAMTPKSVIYELLPNEYIPKTALILEGEDPIEKVKILGLSYPIIAKPNHGLKGLGVQTISNDQELINYSKTFNLPYLIQEKIPHSNEVGIFYCRYPKTDKGFISGVVQKNFMKIQGDGNHTLEQLIRANPRFNFQIERLRNLWRERWAEVIPEEEEITLLEVGSHTRGAEFINISHLIDERLSSKIEEIASRIPGFYYGRFDVLFRDFESLKDGENFKIIELNGAMSEPTHMYDPSNSLWNAWKEILKHWRIMSEIAVQNKGVPIQKTPFRKGLGLFFENLNLEKQLKKQLSD